MQRKEWKNETHFLGKHLFNAKESVTWYKDIKLKVEILDTDFTFVLRWCFNLAAASSDIFTFPSLFFRLFAMIEKYNVFFSSNVEQNIYGKSWFICIWRKNGNTEGYTKIQKSGDEIGSMKPEKCQWRMYIEKLDVQPPAGLIFFIFRRNWPNNRLTPLLFGLAPPLGNPGSNPECA